MEKTEKKNTRRLPCWTGRYVGGVVRVRARASSNEGLCVFVCMCVYDNRRWSHVDFVRIGGGVAATAVGLYWQEAIMGRRRDIYKNSLGRK